MRALQLATDPADPDPDGAALLSRNLAAEIAQFPGVDSARGRAIDDRGTATLAIAVHASRHLDVQAFTNFAHARAAFVADAVEGRAVALRVQLHV